MTDKEFEAIILAGGIEMEREMKRKPVSIYNPEAVKRFRVVCEIAASLSDDEPKIKVDDVYGSGVVAFEVYYTEINNGVLKHLAENADSMEVEMTNRDSVNIVFEVKEVRKTIGYANMECE